MYHDICFLLTELQQPMETYSSNTASSGPGDCSRICTLEMDGQSHQSLKLTSTGDDVRMSVPVLGSEPCTIRVLAVGGGGRGDGGGGGSGYIQYQNITLPPGINILDVTVGYERQPSIVIVNDNMTISAECGEDANGQDGGDGYSGGGDYGQYYGGSDGSQGQGDQGGYGSGTGEDIGEFMMSSWTLSPGAGGKFYEEIFGDNHYGGGGGGVTVYGEGPYASEYQGQGYGGGGSGYSYTNGLQGVVLLETESG